MMDEPMAPGRGLPVYQPATVVEAGTCIEPPAARPSVIRLVFTPISGMVSETGLAIWAAAHCDERARPDERQPRQRRSRTVPRGAAEPGGDRPHRRLAGARGIFQVDDL